MAAEDGNVKYGCCEHCGHLDGKAVPFHPWHSRECWITGCPGTKPCQVNN